MWFLLESASSIDLTETAEESIQYIDQIVQFLIEKGQVLLNALIILVIGWYLCRFVCNLVKKTLDKSRLDASASGFINSLVRYGLLALLVIIVISKLGVDMTSIIALLTTASLAIGLALQDTISNFAGGVLLLAMKPFVVGDYINDGNGHEGTVTSIEIIYTHLLTADNQAIAIPNGQLTDASITNVNRQSSRREDFEVGISYDENIDRVRSVLLGVANESPYLCEDKPPQVFVSSFDSSSIKMVLRIWVQTENYWPAKFEIQEAIKKALDKEHISIPYEHMDVNIVQPEGKDGEIIAK